MVADWVGVTNHAYKQWKSRAPTGTSIGPRVAWDEAILVPTGFWEGTVRASEVWLHIETEMLLIVAKNYDESIPHDAIIRTTYPLEPRSNGWHADIADWAYERH